MIGKASCRSLQLAFAVSPREITSSRRTVATTAFVKRFASRTSQSKHLLREQSVVSDRRIIAMARTESVQLEEGTQAPDFTLPEPLTGKMVSLADVRGSKATVVMIICNHCPFVIMLKKPIVELAKEYQAKGVGFVAISSNSVETHPQDGPEKMAEDAKEQGYPFPYL